MRNELLFYESQAVVAHLRVDEGVQRVHHVARDRAAKAAQQVVHATTHHVFLKEVVLSQLEPQGLQREYIKVH